jgi:disulfide bond formation protein DsbB
MRITAKNLLIFLFCAAFFALTFAYISQFVFGFEPCILCLYQRLPFFAIIVFSIAALFFFKSEKSQKIALLFCLFFLVINVAIASYHVGVEQKILKGPDSCASEKELSSAKNLEELKIALMKTKVVRCDEPSFIFLHLSMAAWNLIYCLALILLVITIALNQNSGYKKS